MSEEFVQSENSYNQDSDPDFGLTEVTITPIDRNDSGEDRKDRPSPRVGYSQESSSNGPKIAGIIIAVLLVFAALWYFVGRDLFSSESDNLADQDIENVLNDGSGGIDSTDEQSDEFGDNDEFADDSMDEGITDEPVDDMPVVSDRPARGELIVVENKTGRTYVIIGSFIDEDLAKDHAAILGRSGINTKLLMPENGKNFYRLSVSDYGSISEAASNLDELKAIHGNNDLWIRKH